MTRSPTHATVLAALLPLAACGPATSDSPLTAARVDTIGGVVQVTNHAAAPEWGLVPVVAFGGLGLVGEARPEDFGRINAVVADADGNIYIGEAQAREVRVFDRSGRHVRTFGRGGAGPGEMQSVQSLAWREDTLYVLDPGNARMQRFTRDGREAGTIHWMPLTGPVEWVRFFPTADGRVHVRGRVPGGVRGFNYVAYDDGAAVDSVFVSERAAPPPSSVVCERPDQVISFFTIPYTPRSVSAPAGHGLAAYAWSAEYRISFLNAAGDTVRRMVRERSPAPIAEREWREAADSFAAFRGRMPAGSSCEPSSISRPAAKPAVLALHFDFDGRLIVEAETEAGIVFDFYDRDGRLEGSVRAPDRDRRIPPYFRGGRVYLVTRDPDLDVQGVAVYEVQR